MSVYRYSNSILPEKYPFAYELINKLNKSFWTLDTIGSLNEDIIDFRDCSTEDKRIIELILKIFTQLEISVAKNYTELFIHKFKNSEIRMALVAIANNESIHAISYNQLAKDLNFPDNFHTEFKNIKELLAKDEFANVGNDVRVARYSEIQSDLYQLSKSIFSEGVSLFGSFSILLNYQRHGIFKKFGDINAYSLIDETEHTLFLSKLFREIAYFEYPNQLSDELKKDIYSNCRKCVELEINFINLVFGENETIHELNKSDLIEYIKYLADRRLLQIGFKPQFGNKSDPLGWISEMCFGVEHTSFFESHNSSYSHDHFLGDLTDWDVILSK